MTSSVPNRTYNLVNPEIWNVIFAFVENFVKISQLPFYLNLADKKLSTSARTGINNRIRGALPFLVVVVHTFLSWIILVIRFSGTAPRNHTVHEYLVTLGLLFSSTVPVSVIGASYTIAITPEVVPSIVNPIAEFEIKFAGLGCGPGIGIRLKMASSEFNYLMKLMFYMALPAAFVMLLAVVLRNLDPLYFVLTTHGEYYSAHWLVLFLLRVILAWHMLCEVVKSTIAFLIIGLLVMCTATQAMEELKSFLCSKSQGVNFHTIRGIKLYREFQLWNQFTNETFCYFAVPPLIFFGVSIMIIETYFCIKAYGIVPAFPYILAPLGNLCSIFFLTTLLPKAAECFQQATQLVRTVRREFEGKYERRVARSLQPLGARCGPYGMISNEWVLAVADFVPNSVVNLLLTF